MGKGEIARYEQFLPSQCVFKRLVSQRHHKVSLCENGLIVIESRDGSSCWLIPAFCHKHFLLF